MDKVLLSIKNLKKSYDKKVNVLKGIDVDFYPGEFVVVIGPSGAGKSTFIRCINRMITPSEGEIIFDGINMEKISGKKLRSQMSNIGMIFQHYNLIGRVNVIKNVLYGRLGKTPLWKSLLGLYNEADKLEAFKLLKQVGLEEQIDHEASMKRRLISERFMVKPVHHCLLTLSAVRQMFLQNIAGCIETETTETFVQKLPLPVCPQRPSDTGR